MESKNSIYYLTYDREITGTLVWYYFICHRQVWLMAHSISPDEDNVLIDLGRIIHQEFFKRENKEFELGSVKIDIIKANEKYVLVAEIKKSSKFLESAMMQLVYYLWRLKILGINAKGKLLFPKERKHLDIELNDELENKLINALNHVKEIASSDKAPKACRIRYCRNCAYFEFCWS